LLDTRYPDSRSALTLQSGHIYHYLATGGSGTGACFGASTIPVGASAISTVLTAVTASAQGHMRFSADCLDQSGYVSNTSMLNFPPATVRLAHNNNAILPLSSQGILAVQPFVNASGGTVDLIIDVTGYYAPPSGTGFDYYPLASPGRLVDTRVGYGPQNELGKLKAGDMSRTFTAKGKIGIPASGVVALSGNAAVVGPLGFGNLRLYPAGSQFPTIANLNYQPGEIIGNGGLVAINNQSQSDLAVYSQQDTDFVYDISGYFAAASTSPPSAKYQVLTPCRLFDTRDNGGQPWSGTRQFQAKGNCSIPATGVSAISLNATVIGPVAAGYLTLYPVGVTQPVVSNLNYPSGLTLGNGGIIKIAPGSGNDFVAYSSQTIQLTIDVTGYFTP